MPYLLLGKILIVQSQTAEPNGFCVRFFLFGVHATLCRCGHSLLLPAVSKGRPTLLRADDFGGRSSSDGGGGNFLFQRTRFSGSNFGNRSRPGWIVFASLAWGELIDRPQERCHAANQARTELSPQRECYSAFAYWHPPRRCMPSARS